ncbi:hydroxymethylglutaryl-CoA synthase [Candidatus Roizmanbacteria bacterium CG_4_9_14_0_2_um_filter_39_13]|uniref:Hydroxymethylglutaryl-CoA synthase n=1 Tax=Candidatus Roizmanbacteria bacterium CG_4_9_14_0_2_um_filter_39_13 TaxID=1974839 RepID=A0A2M8EXW8_9BACT|nr:MAG: hydroxymethylglutaryl-CoA synthase [Candidatus Roizmanbacteria bacterium CG_4_9_14_0_2_um_filter_39_13]
MVGIVDYGFYVPKHRIKVKDIATQWEKCADKVELSLRITEKAVASTDEDILTMAYEAASSFLTANDALKKKIGAVFVGSETFPYAVKPTSTSLAEWLMLSHDYLAYDTQFACKAATGALLSAIGMVKSGDISHALVCASDKANARPKDTLEYSASSGANAWLLGREHVIAEVINWHSYSSDTPDFWRRAKAEYPSHAGRFTGVPAYFLHLGEAVKRLLEKSGTKPSDYKHVVFHMPNGSFPLKAAKQLGFTKEQMNAGYVVPLLGNSYSASALMGLVSVLEVALPEDKILFASYGSGAGSDAIQLHITEEIDKKRKKFKQSISQKEYIDYSTYTKFMNMK